MLVEDYAERVDAAAGYLTQLLGDTGARLDAPTEEPLGPEGAGQIDLDPARAELLPVGRDAAAGVTFGAVDGGSACLVNGRSFWVIAYRAGLVHHRDRETVAEAVDPLTVRTLTVADAKAAYADALARTGVVRERELADLGGVVNVLRELAEWEKIRLAISQASPGDVVLVDGGLHPGPFLPASFVTPVHQAALRQGIDLVGVTKASKLRWGRYAPLMLRMRRLAAARGLDARRWYCPIVEAGSVADENGEPVASEVHVARLAPHGAYVFRVDAVRGARGVRELFDVLAGCSDDPAFLGYPYPLARVHQVVSLPGYLLADLRRDLREGCLRAGLAEDEADLVLRDFHQTLNA